MNIEQGIQPLRSE